MKNKEYKGIMVFEETHYQLAIEAKKQRMTHDEFINYLLKEYYASQVKEFKK